MRYLSWALLALVAYTFFPPLMGATTDRVSAAVATFGAAGMLSVTGLALAVLNGDLVIQSMVDHWVYIVATGIALTVGAFSFYYALSLGPVSVVAPIFGLFLVTSPVVGGIYLGESLTVQRGVGVGLAVLAILVISLE